MEFSHHSFYYLHLQHTISLPWKKPIGPTSPSEAPAVTFVIPEVPTISTHHSTTLKTLNKHFLLVVSASRWEFVIKFKWSSSTYLMVLCQYGFCRTTGVKHPKGVVRPFSSRLANLSVLTSPYKISGYLSPLKLHTLLNLKPKHKDILWSDE